jgi:hypothetical protein
MPVKMRCNTGPQETGALIIRIEYVQAFEYRLNHRVVGTDRK